MSYEERKVVNYTTDPETGAVNVATVTYRKYDNDYRWNAVETHREVVEKDADVSDAARDAKSLPRLRPESVVLLTEKWKALEATPKEEVAPVEEQPAVVAMVRPWYDPRRYFS